MSVAEQVMTIKFTGLAFSLAVMDARTFPNGSVAANARALAKGYQVLQEVRLHPIEAREVFRIIDESFNRLASAGYFPTEQDPNRRLVK